MMKRCIFALALGFTFQASAHLELYHRVEIVLQNAGTAHMYVTIHESDISTTAEAYLRDSFRWIVNGEVWSGKPVIDSRASGLPKGCVLASYDLPEKATVIQVRLMEGSAKRLLLVISRPGAFPLARDLAPGEEYRLKLP